VTISTLMYNNQDFLLICLAMKFSLLISTFLKNISTKSFIINKQFCHKITFFLLVHCFLGKSPVSSLLHLFSLYKREEFMQLVPVLKKAFAIEIER